MKLNFRNCAAFFGVIWITSLLLRGQCLNLMGCAGFPSEVMWSELLQKTFLPAMAVCLLALVNRFIGSPPLSKITNYALIALGMFILVMGLMIEAGIFSGR